MNCSRIALVARAVIFTLVPLCSTVHAQVEPRGSYLQTGVAGVSGLGVQVGFVNARDFFTREITALGDFMAALDPGSGSNQVSVTIGGAMRLFGFERTIGNIPYRGYDLDVGFRVGPGLSFSTRETQAEKNRRFNLFIEPYARFSVRVRFVHVLFVEAGTNIPRVRFGAWIPL